MIYVVNGYPGAGKTTFEKMVCDIVGYQSYGWIFSTVDFVKDIAKQCGWDGSKTPKNRKFLSDLKDLLTDWDDVPFKKVRQQVGFVEALLADRGADSSKAVIFIDCREPKEIKKLCDKLGAKSLIVRRSESPEEPILNHADAEVNEYAYDITVWNKGTLLDLAHDAVDFVKHEKLYWPPNGIKISANGNIKLN